MLHLVSILLICSLYVGTYIVQKKLYIGNHLLDNMSLFLLTTTWVNRIIVCLVGLLIFILLSPINFLLILFIQIKSYGKN
jgi:hypothetical protein